MKKAIKTQVSQRFVLTYYKLEKDFPYIYQSLDWQNNARYEDKYVINAGCYKKAWVLKFNNIKDLRTQLKVWFKNDTSVVLYHSVNSALKDKRYSNILTLKEIGNVNDCGFNINLRNKKKRNLANGKKKSNPYYCDCWHCIGRRSEANAKTLQEDELKINELY